MQGVELLISIYVDVESMNGILSTYMYSFIHRYWNGDRLVLADHFAFSPSCDQSARFRYTQRAMRTNCITSISFSHWLRKMQIYQQIADKLRDRGKNVAPNLLSITMVLLANKLTGCWGLWPISKGVALCGLGTTSSCPPATGVTGLVMIPPDMVWKRPRRVSW